jgi:DNA mismatch repair protein MutS2
VGQELVDELEAARGEVAELLASLQSKPTVKQATEAARQLDAWRAQVGQAAKSAEAQAKAGPDALVGAAIERGQRVRVVSLGQEAEVLEVGEDEALVRLGALKLRRPIADLLPLKGKAAPAKLGRSRGERLEAAEGAKAAPVRSPEQRLDARGLRVDELLREVDGFLDRLYAEGVPECVVLHGHGTGALKQALRDHLSASPYVGAFRSGDRHEGGDAVTVVSFRR